MKHYIWFVTLVAVLTVSLVGCNRKSPMDKATEKLQKSFQTADPATQSSVTKALTAVQSDLYPEATAELQKLASNTKLTAEQQAAIKDVMDQIAKAIGQEAKKAGDAANKAAGDMQKALPK